MRLIVKGGNGKLPLLPQYTQADKTALMFIYLDESGDLGFDWSKPGTSRYFTITLLVCDSVAVMQSFESAVKRTLRHKLNPKKKRTRKVEELKGSKTSLAIKQYFYRHAPEEGWGLYSVIINKRRVYGYLQEKEGKPKLYNFLARLLIDKMMPALSECQQVSLILDRSKSKEEIKDFDNYIISHLEGGLPLQTRLKIFHQHSQEKPCLQAVDLFCWGIARQRAHKEDEWFREFSGMIRCNEFYLPG